MTFNKVLRTDLILLVAVVSLFFVRSQDWIDALLGFAAALFVYSIFNHVRHFKLYKKFY